MNPPSSPPSRLIRIEIEGKPFDVPEGELLLSAIQYIVRDLVPVLGRFCWSDECGNCEVALAGSGSPEEERVRGCQTKVEEGMSIVALGPDLRYWLAPKL